MMNLNTIVIRAYEPGDKAAVLHLLRLNTPAYFAPEEEKDLIHYLDHERELYFVIDCDGQVAACGGINFFTDKKQARLSWDIVHPQHQGKALGSRLVRHRIEKIKETENVEQIMVRTSQLAFPFYEKNGFELSEVVKDYWAPGFDLYSMEYRPLH